jgi:hypothetical protein
VGRVAQSGSRVLPGGPPASGWLGGTIFEVKGSGNRVSGVVSGPGLGQDHGFQVSGPGPWFPGGFQSCGRGSFQRPSGARVAWWRCARVKGR